MSEGTRHGVFRWTVRSIEAVIAAPLWAIMHVHPDGEGLTGRGGNGYALVLTVVLRPALMIFGLVAAISLMYPFGAILNEVFPAVFSMSVGSSDAASVGGILTKVAGAFLYVGIMMTLVNKIFSLIHVLPDQILRWIGGSQDYFGRGMEQEALGGAKQAVGSVSGAAQSGYQTHRMAGEHSTGRQIEAELVKGDIARARQDGKPGESAAATAERAERYTAARHDREEAAEKAEAAKKEAGKNNPNGQEAKAERPSEGVSKKSDNIPQQPKE